MKKFGKVGNLLENKKKAAFSLFEIVISMVIFFIFLGILYPNFLLFQKSYHNIKTYVEYRFQERDLHRMLEHFISHSFPLKNTHKTCFLVKNWNEYMLQKNLENLEMGSENREKAVFFSCLFLTKDSEVKKHIFILYFQNHSLFLGEYKNGVFLTGDKILLLEDVEGYFQKKENQLKVVFMKKKGRKEKELYYEIPETKS